MKKISLLAAFFLSAAIILLYAYKIKTQPLREESYCLVGAFLADSPSKQDIISFQENYGKQPFFVMVFIDWEGFIDKGVLGDIFSQGSSPVITWEPWYWINRQGVDYRKILNNEFDDYISDFARGLAGFQDTIYLRFAHEMNGNWYPWSSADIGADNYKAMHRYIKDKFDEIGADNIKWIFSINWENIPGDNHYSDSYPGDSYIDYIGIDGYNWGDSQPWSRWMSFNEIFYPVYREASGLYEKDIIITEFSSTSKGGNKVRWTIDAFSDIKKMERLKGFILFNVDKETDWGFTPGTVHAEALSQQLNDAYFSGPSNVKE
jgi:mannan endo-1,4-beta-mannosidase